MWFFIVLLCIFVVCLFVFILPSLKFNNPYTLTLLLGKKGCGKTTFLSKLAYKYNKMGWTVYSTFECKDCYKIDYSDIGTYDLVDYKNNPSSPSKILLLVDEINLVWDNRSYKDFKQDVNAWLIQMRKYHIKCFMCSQTYTCDKKIRDLSDDIYLMVRLGCLTVCKKVNKFLTIREDGSGEGSNVAEGMEFEKFFKPKARLFTYIPYWVRKCSFNTDEVLSPLKQKQYNMW